MFCVERSWMNGEKGNTRCGGQETQRREVARRKETVIRLRLCFKGQKTLIALHRQD
jgi:hypothetical protein